VARLRRGDIRSCTTTARCSAGCDDSSTRHVLPLSPTGGGLGEGQMRLASLYLPLPPSLARRAPPLPRGARGLRSAMHSHRHTIGASIRARAAARPDHRRAAGRPGALPGAACSRSASGARSADRAFAPVCRTVSAACMRGTWWRSPTRCGGAGRSVLRSPRLRAFRHRHGRRGRPPPPITVRVCDSLSWRWRRRAAARRIARPAGTTVRVVRAPCMGGCHRAPAVAIGHALHENATSTASRRRYRPARPIRSAGLSGAGRLTEPAGLCGSCRRA
jgi:hypothetical protein